VSNLTHYVYYDKKSGHIHSIGNEEDKRYEHGIRTTFEEVENFLNLKWKFKDYVVGYKNQQDGTSILSIVPSTDQGFAFKNNVFEWITETNEDTECTVTWNSLKKEWQFSLSDEFKLQSDKVLTPKLVFFVTLETDFDFLIRTIFIDTQDLISSKYLPIPFISVVENKIDKISISSKLVFQTYKLRIVNE
jgi:hypothetical protein